MPMTAMAEPSVDVTRLPEDVREKLAELELELSEGKFLSTVPAASPYINRFSYSYHPSPHSLV